MFRCRTEKGKKSGAASGTVSPKEENDSAENSRGNSPYISTFLLCFYVLEEIASRLEWNTDVVAEPDKLLELD